VAVRQGLRELLAVVLLDPWLIEVVKNQVPGSDTLLRDVPCSNLCQFVDCFGSGILNFVQFKIIFDPLLQFGSGTTLQALKIAGSISDGVIGIFH
jgi:hypothetical protein